MADIEKVIKGLECCSKTDMCCMEINCYYPTYLDCPYHELEDCATNLVKDALELLRGHEAVEPNTMPSTRGWVYTCGNCGWWLFEARDTVHFEGRKRIHYCASCGCAVKWDA